MSTKKIASGFLANYFQSKDSIICSYVVQYLKERDIPCLTVHDCFKVPYQFHHHLDNAILHAYTRFYNENHFETDFKDDNLVYTTYKTLADVLDKEEFLPSEFNIRTIAKP